MPKKLFGKLNVIDVILILIIILALVGAVYKFVWSRRSEANMEQDITLKFYCSDVPGYAENKPVEGARCVDDGKNVYLGEIISFENEAEAENGKIAEDGNIFILTSRVQGRKMENGVVIEGNLYLVNHGLTLRAGDAKLDSRVMDIIVE